MSEQEKNYAYYIKKLGRQELGSRDDRYERARRGRYILIPRVVENFFPTLSDLKLNDVSFIRLSPIFQLEDGTNPPCCYCDYIFHNSKIASAQANGRNERRIYFSKKIDRGEFFQNDIIILRRRALEAVAEVDEICDGAKQKAGFDFFLDFVRPDTSPDEWQVYNTLIARGAEKAKTGTSVIINGYISMFETKVGAFAPTGLEIDDRIIEALGGKPGQELGSLFDASSFREFVLKAYGGKCAVTRSSLEGGNEINVRAARIHPKCGRNLNLPQNGVAMRFDLAWAFEKGFFTIDPLTLEVSVHESAKSTYLKKYHGSVITPIIKELAPSPEYLAWHKAFIYGSFERCEHE